MVKKNSPFKSAHTVNTSYDKELMPAVIAEMVDPISGIIFYEVLLDQPRELVQEAWYNDMWDYTEETNPGTTWDDGY